MYSTNLALPLFLGGGRAGGGGLRAPLARRARARRPAYGDLILSKSIWINTG